MKNLIIIILMFFGVFLNANKNITEVNEVSKYIKKSEATLKILEESKKKLSYNNKSIDITKYLNKIDNLSQLKKNISTYNIMGKGEFEKTKDFQKKKEKLKEKINSNKIYVSVFQPYKISYSADNEEWEITIGYLSSHKNIDIYKIISNENKQESEYYLNDNGKKVVINKIESLEYGIVSFDKNVEFLSNYTELLSMEINKAKTLKNKIRMKVLYNVAVISSDSILEDVTEMTPFSDFLYHRIATYKHLKVIPIGFIFYYKSNSHNILIKYTSIDSVIKSVKTYRINNQIKKIKVSIKNIKDNNKIYTKSKCIVEGGKVGWDFKIDKPVCKYGNKIKIIIE